MPNDYGSEAIKYAYTHGKTRHPFDPRIKLQTKLEMEKDLKGYVLNRCIPDDIYYRKIWLNAHPGEIIRGDEVIHHINGNHDDNRPENLLKVHERKHATLHAELKRQIGK